MGVDNIVTPGSDDPDQLNQRYQIPYRMDTTPQFGNQEQGEIQVKASDIQNSVNVLRLAGDNGEIECGWI